MGKEKSVFPQCISCSPRSDWSQWRLSSKSLCSSGTSISILTSCFFLWEKPQWFLLKVKLKYFSLKCWQTHDSTLEDPFPQPASLPVRNECHLPSPMLPACHSQLLDLFSQPSPPLNLSSLKAVVGCAGGSSWHTHCVPQLLAAPEWFTDATMKCCGSKNVVAPCWRLKKIITEFLGFF